MYAGSVLKRAVPVGAALAIVAGGLAVTESQASAPHAVAAAPSKPALYEAKRTNLKVDLGSLTAPTQMAVKAVPAGTYLVTGLIGVNAQPDALIVCSVSSNPASNDGVNGAFANISSGSRAVNVTETESIKVRQGQSLHLICHDNNGKAGDRVGEAVLDAIPVSGVH